MNKYVLNIVVLVVGLALGYYFTPVLFGSGSGANHYFLENFIGGITIGDGGSTITSQYCVSNTAYNPASFSSGTVPTAQAINVPKGAAYGDKVLATFATSTNADSWIVVGNVTAAATTDATATISIVPITGKTTGWYAALDLATGTLRVCVTK